MRPPLDYETREDPATLVPAPAHVLTVLIISTIPLSVWCAMAVAAVRTALEVGHWPTYGDDVVHRLGGWVALVDIVGLATPALGAYGVSRYINRRCPPRARVLTTICIAFLIAVAGIALLRLDPGDIGTWWID